MYSNVTVIKCVVRVCSLSCWTTVMEVTVIKCYTHDNSRVSQFKNRKSEPDIPGDRLFMPRLCFFLETSE